MHSEHRSRGCSPSSVITEDGSQLSALQMAQDHKIEWRRDLENAGSLPPARAPAREACPPPVFDRRRHMPALRATRISQPPSAGRRTTPTTAAGTAQQCCVPSARTTPAADVPTLRDPQGPCAAADSAQPAPTGAALRQRGEQDHHQPHRYESCIRFVFLKRCAEVTCLFNKTLTAPSGRVLFSTVPISVWPLHRCQAVGGQSACLSKARTTVVHRSGG